MPNISLYFNDEEYLAFRQLSEGQQKEARDNATKQVLKLIKEIQKGENNGSKKDWCYKQYAIRGYEANASKRGDNYWGLCQFFEEN